jgi:hypothetical protein
VGCLHAYSAASNGDYYGAEKAVDCAAQLIVQCADDEFEARSSRNFSQVASLLPLTTVSHTPRRSMFPKGDPRDPMTEDEIAVKFTAFGGEVIAKDQCEKLQDCIMNIDSAKDADELLA